MVINSNYVKSLIVAKGLSQSDIAANMGITRSAFNMKLNGRAPFKGLELLQLAEILDIKMATDIKKFYKKG